MSSNEPIADGEPIIRLNGVSKDYGDEAPEDAPRAIEELTFTVPEGAFILITGPSGAGKSTLVKMLYAEVPPSSGELFVCGRDLTCLNHRRLVALRREVGVVHQDFHLIGRKSARDNVALALEVSGVGRREALERADEALDTVRLTHHRNTIAVALSGGEKQRVALARALVVKPRLIVADEPTGNLDPELSDEVFALLDRACERGATVIVATHDHHRIESAGHPVLYLEHGRLVGTRGFAGGGA